jgi:hypothetical protein
VIGGIRQATFSDQRQFIKARATFGAVNPHLACEGAGGNFLAASAAWVNISDADGAWAQIGWTRVRDAGSTTIRRVVYIELTWGTIGQPGTPGYYQYREFSDPGDSPNEYRIELDQSTGIWHYYFAGTELTFTNYPSASIDSWQQNYGTQAKWCCEIHDLGSYIAGTTSNHFSMSSCQFWEPSTSFFWSNAGFSNFNPVPRPDYDENITGTSTIEMWDTRP